MDRETQSRLGWIELYRQTDNAGLVCRRCGISRPTLRLWWRRFQADGLEGLKSRSRRPHHSPRQRVGPQQVTWILALRKRGLGVRRIQSELRRWYRWSASLATLHKVLTQNHAPPLHRKRRHQPVHSYTCPIPGERVQMDTFKVRNRLYQFTAIDDCTRLRALKLFTDRSARSSLAFLEYACKTLPFPIQRIQTDRGLEFFAYEFQEQLMRHHIKFRPIRPHSPHLNGKVERSQRTDWDEFYSAASLRDPNLEQHLAEWETYYNQQRPHSSLGGKTPWERWLELASKAPSAQDVCAAYQPSREAIRDQDYSWDQRVHGAFVKQQLYDDLVRKVEAMFPRRKRPW